MKKLSKKRAMKGNPSKKNLDFGEDDSAGSSSTSYEEPKTITIGRVSTLSDSDHDNDDEPDEYDLDFIDDDEMMLKDT
jgi:hypothetical protein